MIRSHRLRPLLASMSLALAASATVVGTAGCGASSVIDPVAQAATVSTGAPGYTATLDMSISSAALPKPITMRGSGRYDVVDHSGSFTMTMALPGTPALTQALGGSAITMREIVEGTVAYVHLPAALAGKLGGKPWLEVDVAKAGGAMPGGMSLLGSNLQMDPGQMLGYLRSISGGVTNVGTDTVGGVSTTHYHATVDLGKAAAKAPPSKRAAAKSSIAAFEKLAHVSRLPVDVWVDGRHLVRKYSSHFAITVRGVPLAMSMTILFPYYGTEPKVSPPPADQVRTLSHLPTPAAPTSGTATPTA